MKVLVICALTLLCTACSLFGPSKEVKQAEKLLSRFECKNIESNEMARSAMTNFHEQTLAVSRQKASTYLEQYKNDKNSLNSPVDQAIDTQYELFKSSCHALGGVLAP